MKIAVHHKYATDDNGPDEITCLSWRLGDGQLIMAIDENTTKLINMTEIDLIVDITKVSVSSTGSFKD